MLIRLLMVLCFFYHAVDLRASEKIFEDSEYPSVLAISMHKTGTFLLRKLLEKFGFKRRGLPMISTIRTDYQVLQLLSGKNYFSAHLIAPLDEADMLYVLQHKVIFISRDPRDQIVSMAFFMKRYNDIWIDGDLPLDKLISKLIVAFSIYDTHVESLINDPLLKDIGSIKDFYDLYKGWNYPGVYQTRFEKLVGAKGGGSDVEQYQEIVNIANYLELNLENNEIEVIQADLFGNAITFREGQIGSWKKHFTQEDIQVFKQVAGQLLIDMGYEKDLNW